MKSLVFSSLSTAAEGRWQEGPVRELGTGNRHIDGIHIQFTTETVSVDICLYIY